MLRRQKCSFMFGEQVRTELAPVWVTLTRPREIGTEKVRCQFWPLVGLFTSRRRVPLLATRVNMAKNKAEKKRLTFVSPLEAKQVRYILYVLNLQARKAVGEETPTVDWLWFQKIPPIWSTHRLCSTHYAILFAYQCRACDNLFHFYATKLVLPIVHWWRV